MDYFQPIHQQSKIAREVGPLEYSLTKYWCQWIFWMLVLYLGPIVIFSIDARDYKRELYLNLGHGAVPECSHRDDWGDYECKQCPMELHQHYSKAWRRVK